MLIFNIKQYRFPLIAQFIRKFLFKSFILKDRAASFCSVSTGLRLLNTIQTPSRFPEREKLNMISLKKTTIARPCQIKKT